APVPPRVFISMPRTSMINTLSLHDALPILLALLGLALALAGLLHFRRARTTFDPLHPERASRLVSWGIYRFTRNPMYLGMLCLRSEEHTSELQSRENLVCRLLLEKKK